MLRHKLTLAAIALVAICGIFLTVVAAHNTHRTPTIKTSSVQVTKGGSIVGIKGDEQPKNGELISSPSHGKIIYNSPISSVDTHPNALTLSWKQTGEGVSLEVRTKNKDAWSAWVPASADGNGKDKEQTNGTLSTLVLAKRIDAVQYRFILQSAGTQASTLYPDSVAITSIDSTDGPNGKASPVQQLLSTLSLSKTASAMEVNPRIISREEWGCPQPNYSNWPPEYHDLGRAIIHHTATTEETDSYATVRAIWQYHTYSNGWGDIGYNYLVDRSGNIFQGRYYEQSYATTNHVDVIGGHAYGNNIGTTGISAIGNYTSSAPSSAQIDSISRIIGYKLAPYNVDPAGDGGYGPAVVGHFEVYPTSCPGTNLISQFPIIKSRASHYYRNYNQQYHHDYSYVGQRLLVNGSEVSSDTPVSPSDSVIAELRLKNEGVDVWSNTDKAVVLGATNPSNRSSVFYNPSWLSLNRTGSFVGKVSDSGAIVNTPTVAPGEIAVFSAKYTVPKITTTNPMDTTQVFHEHFRPLIEGVLWLPRDIGYYQSVTVKKQLYDYSPVGQQIYKDAAMTSIAPSQLLPDTDYYFSLSLKNTGTVAWDKSLRLGTSNNNDRSSILATSSWLSNNRAASINETQVEPGQIGTFTFKIRTPSPTSDLTTKEYFQPVVDGVAWLKDTGIYFSINTVHAVYAWQYVTQGQYLDASQMTPIASESMTPGSRYYLALTLRNTGTLPYYANQLRIGTSSPLDRTSTAYDSSWIGTNRPAQLTTSVVYPGESTTLGFWVMKRDAIQRKEYFRPVVDGKAWLQDVGLYWAI